MHPSRTERSCRIMTVGAVLLCLGVRAAADDEQIKWIKLDEARAKSAATGKPILVLGFTDLLPDGPPTKSIDRSFTSEIVRSRKDDFLFVKCTDMNTAKAVKATSKCELIFLDPEGDEIHRGVAKSTQDVAAAMKSALGRYANQPISWAGPPPSPLEGSPPGKKLTVVLFRDGSDDVDVLIRSLEDRSVAKLHPLCTFVALAFRKDSPDVAGWNVSSAPTLLLLDAEKDFGPKAVLERSCGRKTAREIRSLLRKGLADVEKSRR